MRFVWEDGKRDGEVLKWVLELVGESGKGGGKEFRVEVRFLPLPSQTRFAKRVSPQKDFFC